MCVCVCGNLNKIPINLSHLKECHKIMNINLNGKQQGNPLEQETNKTLEIHVKQTPGTYTHNIQLAYTCTRPCTVYLKPWKTSEDDEQQQQKSG